MLRDKSTVGVGVNALFAILLTITPLPEKLHKAAMVGIWSCFVLACLWWLYLWFTTKPKEKRPPAALGGAGGSVEVGSGLAIGGKGGRGGSPGMGSGGAGGGGKVTGHGIAIGGGGGDAGFIDKDGNPVGGAGGQSGLEIARQLMGNGPTWDGIDAINALLSEYELSKSTDPIDEWINARLRARGLGWIYKKTPNGYELSEKAQ